MAEKIIRAVTVQKGETIDYTLSEFAKYVDLISRGEIKAVCEKTGVLPEGGYIRLGLLDELGLPADDLHDPFVEDIIDIDVHDGVGHIAGSNPRSILMGIYKYFTSAGCRFMRPGKDGEYIPYCDLTAHSFTYRKKADYDYRGECSEGAVSYEHMRDTVYWSPKVGMNMYMIESQVPYGYMHKWYAHVGNTKLRRHGFLTDYDFLEEKIGLLEQDIKRVGLQFHSIGHGWMFDALGVRRTNPIETQSLMENVDKRHLAMLNGKREIHNDAFYTQLCYSNPETRKLLVDFVLDYARKKPHVDFLHLWLADAANNDCECPKCVRYEPSDWYVLLLNEIDEALTKAGSQMRLVFILYVETVRPPKVYRLKNPGRFLLLTAIGVPYDVGYRKVEYKGEIHPYNRNHYKAATSPLALQWHDEWKKLSGNIPSCIFEYRFYADQYCDPGHMQIARETHKGMRALTDVNFQGCMNDQTPRAFFPTALPMLLMAETLFDRETDFEAYTTDYFTSAFGADGAACREYLEKVTAAFHPSCLRRGGTAAIVSEDEGIEAADGTLLTWEHNAELAADLRALPDVVADFLPTIEKNMASAEPCHAASWRYLRHHADIIIGLAEVFAVAAGGDIPKAVKLFQSLENMISEREMELHEVFDLFLFVRNFRPKLGLQIPTYYD